jgi:hypothetical protein
MRPVRLADTTHQTDQIFRVLSVPADGQGKEAEVSVRPRFMGSSCASFISLSIPTDMGARHAKHNRSLRIYLCVQANAPP